MQFCIVLYFLHFSYYFSLFFDFPDSLNNGVKHVSPVSLASFAKCFPLCLQGKPRVEPGRLSEDSVLDHPNRRN